MGDYIIVKLLSDTVDSRVSTHLCVSTHAPFRWYYGLRVYMLYVQIASPCKRPSPFFGSWISSTHGRLLGRILYMALVLDLHSTKSTIASYVLRWPEETLVCETSAFQWSAQNPWRPFANTCLHMTVGATQKGTLPHKAAFPLTMIWTSPRSRPWPGAAKSSANGRDRLMAHTGAAWWERQAFFKLIDTILDIVQITHTEFIFIDCIFNWDEAYTRLRAEHLSAKQLMMQC